jgi:hypothetical protein
MDAGQSAPFEQMRLTRLSIWSTCIALGLMRLRTDRPIITNLKTTQQKRKSMRRNEKLRTASVG